MSALARWFLAQNWLISGSDAAKTIITQELQKEGLKVKIGHKKADLGPKTGLLVYSQAVKQGNPELKKAEALKTPALSYPEATGNLTKIYKTIAVAGSHGKSTTTALVSLILKNNGINPTVILGTNLKEFGGKNFNAGKSSYLVLEADEWMASFLHYSPTFTLITNIDREHLDFYKNLEDIKKTFLKFLSRTKNGGVLVLNRDNKPLLSLKSKIEKIGRQKNLKIFWYSIREPIATKIRKIIKIPGEHNISNAVAAYTLCHILKVPEQKILSALSRYQGAWRRMEYKGELRIMNKELMGEKKTIIHNSKFIIHVYDDYAHHPTEIKATLQAFHEKFPKSKIICVFQPHQAKRLQALFKEFVGAFDGADILILLPIYQVAGRDKSNPLFTSEKLAAAIRKRNPTKPVFYLKNPGNLKRELTKILHSKFYILNSPVIVMMGAGDIVKYTDSLIS